MSLVLGLLAIASIGLVWLYMKWTKANKESTYFQGEYEKAQAVAAQLQEEVIRLGAQLDVEQKVAAERKKLKEESEASLKHTFESLSQKALAQSQANFLELAKKSFAVEQEKAKGEVEKQKQSIAHLINPIEKSLKGLDEGMRHLEKERKGDQASIKTMMQALMSSEKELRAETSQLARALKAPLTGGRWGEIQLKRVIELSGMINRCDFYEQVSAR